jgi:uncharacterized OB-fold protein
MKKQLPVAEGVFTWSSGKPHLIGSRCEACGEYFFPKVKLCQNPDCPDKSRIKETILSRIGRLWSYTIQYYKPPFPYQGPAPLMIGLVELPENLKVMGQLTNCEEQDLRIGMEMELVIEKLFEDQQGNEVLTWKFRPTRDATKEGSSSERKQGNL